MAERLVTIGAVQPVVSRDVDSNLAYAHVKVQEAIGQGAQIVCLPELFRAPYFPRRESITPQQLVSYSETIPGISTDVFTKVARDNGIYIIVPVFEKAVEDKYYNSAVLIHPNGEVSETYRKIHIPHDPGFYEQNYFSNGNNGYKVYDTEIGKVAILICYDQWFPEAARAVALDGAEIIFYPTAIAHKDDDEQSMAAQSNAWETVQRSHAIANHVHVATVNRVGREGMLDFWGSSFVVDGFGQTVSRSRSDLPQVMVATVDLATNEYYREGWRFMYNRQPETYGKLVE